jgi:hypothetical protein
MPNLKLLLPFFVLWGLFFPLYAQNDKQVIGDAVFTSNEIEEGVEVMFLIRFQNLGNDTANNIVVRDTLDPRYDASSFQMVDASHNYQLLRDQGFVRWYFNGIRLPSAFDAMSDNPNSTGFVQFTVQPLRFLTPNQTIQNRACITFDDAAPICTNFASIWIDEGADSPEPSGNRNFKIVPNPNYGHFEVQKLNLVAPNEDNLIEWWISDMNGKTIWDGTSLDLVATPNQVMLERPNPGLYMLWMKDNGRLQVEQFAVIR